jgi:hypothetical protein
MPVTDENQNGVGTSADDIVFECPHCGKSLAIALRGAGMMIKCPDCQARVQVPGIAEADSAAEPAPVEQSADETASADKPRVEARTRFEAIGKEIGLIQAALDRIVGILQDAEADNAPERD